MRRAAKVDANQPAIVEALRRVGCEVEVTSTIGGGFPDLIVGYRGVNHMLEVKDGSKPPSARKLTPDQERWHARWRGRVVVVESVEDALRAVGAIR
jgi:hypothetical protein